MRGYCSSQPHVPNTAVEFGPEDPTGNDAIQRYFQRLSGAFLNALENAQSNEDLHQDANVEEIANHLTAVVLGLFVLIRANAPNEIVGNAANMAIEKVKSFTVGDYTST